MKINKKNKKQLYRIIGIGLKILITILIFYNVIYLVENTFSSNEYVHVFGNIIYTNSDDTLNDYIGKNSFIVIKQQEVKEGDIIAYNNNNTLLLKRISKIYNENGEKMITVKADKNYYYEDIPYNNVKGKVVCSIPWLGFLFSIFEFKFTSIIVGLILIFVYLYRKERERRKNLRKKKKEAYYI